MKQEGKLYSVFAVVRIGLIPPLLIALARRPYFSSEASDWSSHWSNRGREGPLNDELSTQERKTDVVKNMCNDCAFPQFLKQRTFRYLQYKETCYMRAVARDSAL